MKPASGPGEIEIVEWIDVIFLTKTHILIVAIPKFDHARL